MGPASISQQPNEPLHTFFFDDGDYAASDATSYGRAEFQACEDGCEEFLSFECFRVGFGREKGSRNPGLWTRLPRDAIILNARNTAHKDTEESITPSETIASPKRLLNASIYSRISAKYFQQKSLGLRSRKIAFTFPCCTFDFTMPCLCYHSKVFSGGWHSSFRCTFALYITNSRTKKRVGHI